MAVNEYYMLCKRVGVYINTINGEVQGEDFSFYQFKESVALFISLIDAEICKIFANKSGSNVNHNEYYVISHKSPIAVNLIKSLNIKNTCSVFSLIAGFVADRNSKLVVINDTPTMLMCNLLPKEIAGIFNESSAEQGTLIDDLKIEFPSINICTHFDELAKNINRSDQCATNLAIQAIQKVKISVNGIAAIPCFFSVKSSEWIFHTL